MRDLTSIGRMEVEQSIKQLYQSFSKIRGIRRRTGTYSEEVRMLDDGLQISVDSNRLEMVHETCTILQ